MEPEHERLIEVVDAILRYLHSHPDAVDTVEGISKWWLPLDYCADKGLVKTALDRLESQGLVHKRSNADRHVLYSR